MGRALRLHQPGCAFHVVSRTQGHEPLFTDDIKTEIADLLLRGVASAGARPIAFAVMNTHFHLILLQGAAPLGWTMQPVLRRIALLVHAKHNREGHVFERRYRAKLCNDREYLPNAILYVHRNPIEAAICRRAADYRWSSAAAYEGYAPPGLLAINEGLQAFDPLGTASLDQTRTAYQDRLVHTDKTKMDEYWTWFWRAVRRKRDSVPVIPQSRHVHRASLRDLRDVALVILRTIDPDIPVDLVRSRYGGPHVVAVRTQLIAALLQRDYPNVKIAKYLRISESTVSRVRSGMRWGSIRGIAGPADMEDGKQVR